MNNKINQKFLFFIGFPLYGVLVSFIPKFTNNDYPIPIVVFYLNPIATMLGMFMTFPLQKIVSSSESIIYPILIVTANLIFWIPIAHLINKYLEKRKMKSRNSANHK